MMPGGFAEKVSHKEGKIELRGNVTNCRATVTVESAASSEIFQIENMVQTEVGIC